MRFFIYFVCVLALMVYVACDLSEDIIKWRLSCKIKDKIQNLQGNCYGACILNSTGVLINGTINSQRLFEIPSHIGEILGMKIEVKESKIKNCIAVANHESDDCKIGLKFFKCFIPPPHMLFSSEEVNKKDIIA